MITEVITATSVNENTKHINSVSGVFLMNAENVESITFTSGSIHESLS